MSITSENQFCMNQKQAQTLCFYGPQFSRENIEKSLLRLCEFTQSSNLEFDKLLLMPIEGRKSKSFPFSISTFMNNFDPNKYSMVTACKVWNTGWSSDYKFEFFICKNRAVFTCADENVSLNLVTAGQLIVELGSILKSRYGVYIELPYDTAPRLFSGGIIKGNYYDDFLLSQPGNSHEKSMRFCRWADTGLPEKVYLRGVIRDVYQLNLLCHTQVYYNFYGKPFINCVRSGEIEGTIKEVGYGQYLWTVPKTDIPNATNKCDQAGYIFYHIENVPGEILYDDPDVAEYHKGDARRKNNAEIVKKIIKMCPCPETLSSDSKPETESEN